ncbi:MAG: MaoC family dehydratase [Haloarculaceae archaeon]
MPEAPAKDTDRYFEEIEAGETYAVEDQRTITEADIVNFAGISGDFHPLHMSVPFAEESGFGERLAHGNLVFSIAEAIIADMNPRSFSYGYDELRFIEPVPIGTTISVEREIVEREDYSEEYGRVVYQYTVTNDEDETVLSCRHITLVEKREA